ncbi:MAG: HD domain-containing protein [Thermoplasmatota archaeon]
MVGTERTGEGARSGSPSAAASGWHPWDAFTPLTLRLRDLVVPLQAKADPAHDMHHLDRVAFWADRLAKAERVDREIVTMAAYVHDLDRAGLAQPRAAEGLLDELGLVASRRAAVLECVARVSDATFRPPGRLPCSLEAQVLQDADKLEAIGAIGVARAFSFGGTHDRPLWDGSAIVVSPIYQKGTPSSNTLQHFADKLLRFTPDEFNTVAGREEATRRFRTIAAFVDEFVREFGASAPALSEMTRLADSI